MNSNMDNENEYDGNWTEQDIYDQLKDFDLEPLAQKYVLFIVSVIMACIMVIGMIGNVITCIVIACNKTMRTTTNCYLFSLAISDLMLLVTGVPHEIYITWNLYHVMPFFGDNLCFFRKWITETSINVSILTITAFTIERYLAICHPFVAQMISKLSRAIKIIIAIWVVGFICAGAIAFQTQVVYIGQTSLCMLGISTIYKEFQISMFFFVPMTVITILYILIGVHLFRAGKLRMPGAGHREIRRTGSKDSSNRGVLKMLVVVVLAFFVCWAPFNSQRIMYETIPDLSYDEYKENKKVFIIVLYYAAGILYLLSGAINPIIYSIMSKKFRNAFKSTLARSCGRSRKAVQKSFSSTSNTKSTNNSANIELRAANQNI